VLSPLKIRGVKHIEGNIVFVFVRKVRSSSGAIANARSREKRLVDCALLIHPYG